MVLYGAYLVFLLVFGPILEREPLRTTLWLTPLALAALLGNWLLPTTHAARWGLCAFDAALITISALLREGADDYAVLFFFPLLSTLSGRTDRKMIVTSTAVLIGCAGVLAAIDGALIASADVAINLALMGGILWLTTRRGHMLTERLTNRERDFDRLSLTFSRYFSPQVAQLLAAQGQSALATGRRDVSVLFADLSGFTSFTESHPAEVVVAALGQYLDELCRVALHHDGTVDKFMGDEVMVVWNAPATQPDHARRALACARDMLLVMEILNQERAQRGDTVLGLSIGINTGEAVVGHIGGQDRVQYTVIGDAVNVAKRLQSAATAGQIVAGLSTASAAGEPPRITEELQLKGRSATVTAVRLCPSARQSAA